jgi:hypothetical protein
VVAHGRVVTGAEGTRLHEEVVTAGGLIEQGRLTRATTDEVVSWLAASSDQPVPPEVGDRLRGLRPELCDPLGRLLARRYADPTARWFPAAVEFLVPVAIARAAR